MSSDLESVIVFLKDARDINYFTREQTKIYLPFIEVFLSLVPIFVNEMLVLYILNTLLKLYDDIWEISIC